jgi:hypothetical protein
MVCTKNKTGIPQREGKALVRYGIGFDNFWSARKILEFNGLIKSAGAWIKLDDSLGGDSINGGKALVEKATNNPQWRQMLIDRAVNILAEDRAKKMSGVDAPE